VGAAAKVTVKVQYRNWPLLTGTYCVVLLPLARPPLGRLNGYVMLIVVPSASVSFVVRVAEVMVWPVPLFLRAMVRLLASKIWNSDDPVADCPDVRARSASTIWNVVAVLVLGIAPVLLGT